MDAYKSNQENGTDQAIMEEEMVEKMQPNDVDLEITNHADKKTPFEQERAKKTANHNKEIKTENMNADTTKLTAEKERQQTVNVDQMVSAEEIVSNVAEENTQLSAVDNEQKINPLTYLMLPGQLFVVVASNILMSAFAKRKNKVVNVEDEMDADL